MLNFLLFTVVTVFIGLPLVLVFIEKENIFEITGLSLPVGLGIVTLILFLLNTSGIKLNLFAYVSAVLLLSILFYLFRKKQIGGFLKELLKSVSVMPFNARGKIVLIVIIFLLFSSLLGSTFWPVIHWDALTLYDFRANVMLQTGTIRSLLFDSYYVEYPFLTSIAHWMVYIAGSSNPKFLYSAYYVSFGLVFYGLLKRFIPKTLSMFFVLLLLTIPIFYNHSLNSYTNLPYTFYFSLSAIYLFLSDVKNNKKYLILSGFLLGLATWTRSIEPFWLGMVLIVFVFAVLRKRFSNILIFLVSFLPIQQIWRIFQGTYGTRGTTGTELYSYLSALTNILDFRNWGRVMVFFYGYVLKPWGIIFWVFILSVFFIPKFKKNEPLLSIYFISLLFIGMLLAGTFVNSFIQTSGCFEGCGDAATRVSMIIYPLLIYSVALTYGKMAQQKPS